MNYILEHNREEIELPAYTFDLQEELEKATDFNLSEKHTLREKGEYLYKFECKLLGKEKTEEIIGGDLKVCDPNEIQTLFVHITRTYDKPINDINAEEHEDTMEYMEQMKGLAVEMNKVPDTVKKVNGMSK